MLITRTVALGGHLVEVTSDAEAIEALASGARSVASTRATVSASRHWPFRHRVTPEGVTAEVPRSMPAGEREGLRRHLTRHFGPVRIVEAEDESFGFAGAEVTPKEERSR